MLIHLYWDLFVMTVTASFLFFILKLFQKITPKLFSASWHYKTYLFICTFFIIPYQLILSFFDLLFPNQFSDLSAPISAGTKIIYLPADHDAYLPETTNHFSFTSLTALGIAVCVIGTILFLAATIFQSHHLQRKIMRNCKKAENPLMNDVLQACMQEMKLKKSLTIYTFDGQTSPFLWGVLKPQIIMPNTEFSQQELHQIFSHELTHLKRHDLLLKQFLIIVNAVHWFNPLVYVLRHEINHYCELSCDESVVKSMDEGERLVYCELIFSVLNKTANQNLASAFSGKQKHLERRIVMILRDKSLGKRKLIRITALAFSLLLGSVGMITAYAASNPSKSTDITESSASAASSAEVLPGDTPTYSQNGDVCTISIASSTGEPEDASPPYSDDSYINTFLTYDENQHCYRYNGKWVRTIDDCYTWNGNTAGGLSYSAPGQAQDWGAPIDLKVIRNPSTNQIEKLVEMTETERQAVLSSINSR